MLPTTPTLAPILPTNNSPVVLWLASWYPTQLDPFPGDFIQRSAQAVSTKIGVNVLHIAKDESATITRHLKTIVTTNNNLTETIIYYHIRPCGIRYIDQLRSTYKYFNTGRNWLKQFKKQHHNKPILVEVGVAMRAGLLALWMKKKWKQPFIVQEHWVGYYRHLMPTDLQRPPLFWFLTKKILDHADWLLPDSEDLGATIQKKWPMLSYTEIPNVVDTQLFYFKSRIPAEGSFRFIHVSTLGHQKNTSGIIRCFQRLQEKFPQKIFELVIVGPNPALLQAEFSGLSGLHFTGPLSYEQVAEQLRMADTMVLFSRYENLPCVMLEAFCCGLPVIATNVGGISHHLTPQRGWLIPSEDEVELLATMQKMLENIHQFNNAKIAQDSKLCYDYNSIAAKYLHAYTHIYPHYFKVPPPTGI